jgi:hypothetical protein
MTLVTSPAVRALVVLSSLVATVGAKAPEPRRRLVVLEVGPRESVRKDPGLAEVPSLVTDALRHGAVGATDGFPYDVMTRDIMQGILENMDECTGSGGGECTLSLGQTLQADVVLGGELSLLDGQLILSLELYDVKKRSLLDTRRVIAPTAGGLLEKVPNESLAVLKKGLVLRSFASGVDLTVPVIDMSRTQRIGLSNLNKEAESAFARAKAAQDDAASTPERKMSGWCDLSAITENNRYLETARPACEGWRRYVDSLASLRRTLPDDYDKIALVLSLDHIQQTEKQQLLDEFVDTYQSLKDDQRVKMVTDARRHFLAGRRTELRTLNELEHEAARLREAEETRRETAQRALEETAAREQAARQESERVAAEREATAGRLFSGETASALLIPSLRFLEAGVGTVLEVALLVGVPLFLLAFGGVTWAALQGVASQVGQKSSDPKIMALVIVLVTVVAVVPIAVLAAGGGGVFLGPVKKLVLGWLMGGDISIRPISAALHPVVGCMVFPLWFCAPFAMLDYALGMGAVVVRAYKGEPRPPPKDITD